MSDYIKKIRVTEQGEFVDKQIDYNALANLPAFKKTLYTGTWSTGKITVPVDFSKYTLFMVAIQSMPTRVLASLSTDGFFRGFGGSISNDGVLLDYRINAIYTKASNTLELIACVEDRSDSSTLADKTVTSIVGII